MPSDVSNTRCAGVPAVAAEWIAGMSARTIEPHAKTPAATTAARANRVTRNGLRVA
jgi:hypothetical protein